MYSDEPPLVDPLGDEDFYAYSATQGRGVLVRSSLPLCGHCQCCPTAFLCLTSSMGPPPGVAAAFTQTEAQVWVLL